TALSRMGIMKTKALALLLVSILSGSAIAVEPDEGCKGADSGSYSAIASCGDSEFKKVETELNNTYKQLISALKKDAARRKLVIESQRSWLVYREKSCDFWHEILSYQVSWCRYGVTKNRLDELKHMYGCYVEGGNEC
ncbi:MAG: lysozyme inhibitor LprI family protein, partial [Gammaproteobacteria bacterium]